MRRQRRALYDALGREEAERIEALRARRGGRLMNEAPRKPTSVVCREFVEQVTAYLDDELPGDVRRGIDAHLEACADCTRVLAQFRRVVTLTGRLSEEDIGGLGAGTRDLLLAAFRAQTPAAPD